MHHRMKSSLGQAMTRRLLDAKQLLEASLTYSQIAPNQHKLVNWIQMIHETSLYNAFEYVDQFVLASKS